MSDVAETIEPAYRAVTWAPHPYQAEGREALDALAVRVETLTAELAVLREGMSRQKRGADSAAHHAQVAESRVETLENALRREWWLNHGCGSFFSLYGDDGEMQCSECAIDFKREPFESLRAHVVAARSARAAALASRPAGEETQG